MENDDHDQAKVILPPPAYVVQELGSYIDAQEPELDVSNVSLPSSPQNIRED